MCSIFFIQGILLPLNKLLAISQLMKHRGPDASGYYQKEDLFLSHNRLAIMDLSDTANQPFFSRSKKHLIIYNGEIYNFIELAKQYHIDLRTACDTELVVELYEKIGEKMLSQLNGMFAFVILNVQTKAIFVARDRLGIKPLYYYQMQEVLSFSSEISPLLELCEKNEIDEIGLRQYKKLRTFFNGHTLYKNIKSFAAGHYFKDGKFIRYWSPPCCYPTASIIEDYTLFDLIKSSIAYCSRADVPIGTFLSGGIDSSLVTLLSQPQHTWSVGFAQSNEFNWAEIVSELSGSKQHNTLIDHEIFLSTAKTLINQRKEPLSVPNEVLLYLMSKQAKEKNKVILCGEGADELFFGYNRIFTWANQQKKLDLKEFDMHYSYVKEVDLEILEQVLEPYQKENHAPIEVVANFFLTAHLHGLLKRLDNSAMMAGIETQGHLMKQ